MHIKKLQFFCFWLLTVVLLCPVISSQIVAIVTDIVVTVNI